LRHKQPFHNRSFGESQNNQPIADDQSMLANIDCSCILPHAEAFQHSMLAIKSGISGAPPKPVAPASRQTTPNTTKNCLNVLHDPIRRG
jgi:hypothetical protein